MNVNDLQEKLNEMSISKEIYSINSAEYSNETYSIFWNGSEWEVYYSERGKKRGIKKFLDESEACEHFLKQISRMKTTDKKEIKYLNVCMNKALHEEFDAFCKNHGMSKVGATEQAIRQYMDKINKALKSVK